MNQERKVKDKKYNKLLKDYVGLKEKYDKACKNSINLKKYTKLVKDHAMMKKYYNNISCKNKELIIRINNE